MELKHRGMYETSNKIPSWLAKKTTWRDIPKDELLKRIDVMIKRHGWKWLKKWRKELSTPKEELTDIL